MIFYRDGLLIVVNHSVTGVNEPLVGINEFQHLSISIKSVNVNKLNPDATYISSTFIWIKTALKQTSI